MSRNSPTASFKQALTYRLESWLVRGPLYRVLAIWCLILVIAVLGGTLAWLLPEKEFGGIGEAVWWAFLRLSDPGYLGEEEETGGRVLALILTVLGLAIFVGALIAIITQWLTDLLGRLALGMTPIRAEDHVVILGWTSRSLEIVASLVLATGRFRPPKVAVMVDRITDELVHAVESRVGSSVYRRQVILRSGDPRQADHLVRVDCGHARAIIVPSDDTASSDSRNRDADTLRILANLGQYSFHEDEPMPQLAVELSSSDTVDIAHATYPGGTQIVASSELIGRSMGMALTAPGLSFLVADLFDAREGATFAISRLPQLAGETIGEAETRFSRAVLLGVLARDDSDARKIRFESDLVLEADDQMIFLAPNDDPIEPDEAGSIDSGETLAIEVSELRMLPSRSVLVLGWNGKVPYLLSELGRRPSDGTTVDIVSSLDRATRSAALSRQPDLEGLRLEQIMGDPRSARVFETHDPAGYDSVVMVTSEGQRDPDSAVSRTVATYCALEYALRDAPVRPHVVIELVHPSGASLFESRDVEVLTTPTLVADTLAGVVTHPDLLPLIDGMLSGQFGMVRTIEVEKLIDADREIDLYLLQSRLRKHGVVLIGLQRAATGRALDLTPDKRTKVRFEPGDRAIVILTN